jgi:HK97 family phage major capsid protein
VTTATQTRRERLERLVTDMRTFASECDAKDGGASGEDIAKLNKMGQDVKALADEVKAEAEAMGNLDVAKAFLGELAGQSADQAVEKAPTQIVDGIVNPNGMTLGEAFTKSPAYEEFLSQFKGADGRIREVSNIKSATFDVPGFNTKAPVTGSSDTSGGAFITPSRLGITSDLIGERRLTVRDLCTNITINSDTFEYVTITGKTNNAAAVAEATDEADPAYTTDGSTVTITPAAGGGYKPQSAMTFAVVSEPVQTIAHLIPITRRAAADAPQVRQMVDAFLLYGLKEEEEDQILNGNGTSPNLSGILDRSISTVGSAGTDLDAVVDAIRTIRADNRDPNGLVVNPNDWYSTGFLLAKDSAGNYLVGDPRASLDQLNQLWGLRVVVTPAMTEGTLLVGDFRQAVVADRQQSAIYVTDSHKDWFARNLLAVLAEERLGFGVLDEDAFCTVTSV